MLCVCFEPYERVGGKCPKLLPCVHTFCVQCLTRLIKNGKMRCPECRSWHPLSKADVHNLPVNSSRILDSTERSVCNDVTANIQEVAPLGDVGNLVQHRQGCSKKRIAVIVLCLCILIPVIIYLSFLIAASSVDEW